MDTMQTQCEARSAPQNEAWQPTKSREGRSPLCVGLWEIGNLCERGAQSKACECGVSGGPRHCCSRRRYGTGCVTGRRERCGVNHLFGKGLVTDMRGWSPRREGMCCPCRARALSFSCHSLRGALGTSIPRYYTEPLKSRCSVQSFNSHR